MSKTNVAVAAALFLAGAAHAADTGAPSAQERDEVRGRIHAQLTTQGQVAEKDARDLDAETSANAAHAGYGPALQKAIQADLAAGCTGTCLASDVHAINGAIARGVPPDEAARAARGAGGPADPQASAADPRREEGHRAAASDRAHDASMGHGPAGEHGMGGGRR